MKTLLLICCFMVFITGCKNKDIIPGNVLPPKKMQTILWDMMRADQFLADYVLNKDTTTDKKTESIKKYQQIFAINKITKEEFQRSFNFYTAHPALLKTIMDSVMVILEKPKAGISKPQKVKDSLHKKTKNFSAGDTAPVFKRIKRFETN